jgi:hypothetical protein
MRIRKKSKHINYLRATLHQSVENNFTIDFTSGHCVMFILDDRCAKIFNLKEIIRYGILKMGKE